MRSLTSSSGITHAAMPILIPVDGAEASPVVRCVGGGPVDGLRASLKLCSSTARREDGT
jgi:hypothetical protein